MTIAWQHFTPWASLAGGLLLGLAAALFILLNGRVLGISGIVAAEITTARPIPEELKKTLHDTLASATGRTVRLTFATDTFYGERWHTLTTARSSVGSLAHGCGGRRIPGP